MVNDLDTRLRGCFSLVFPTLGDGEIETASTDSVEEWDSLKTVMLVSVVEEEFGTEVPIDRLEEMVSYRGIVSFLRENAGG